MFNCVLNNRTEEIKCVARTQDVYNRRQQIKDDSQVISANGTTNYVTDADKTRTYVSCLIQRTSGDLKQILAVCIDHRPAQFSKQLWFTTTRFLSETMKPEVVQCLTEVAGSESLFGLHQCKSSSTHLTLGSFRKL